MGSSTFNDTLFLTKRMYDDAGLRVAAYEKSPLAAMIPKKNGWPGNRELNWALQIGEATGASVTYSFAVANTGTAQGVQWSATRQRDYAVLPINWEAEQSSKTKEGAFSPISKATMIGGYSAYGTSFKSKLYGDSSGALATVASVSASPGANVITLTNYGDFIRFYYGMQLVSAASTTAATDDTAATHKVIGISAGNQFTATTITVDGTLANNWGAAGRILFRQGDYVAAADRICPYGVANWIPVTAPTATTFCGIDRTQDIQKLSGWRLAASGATTREGLSYGVANSLACCSDTKAIFCSTNRWMELSNNIDSSMIFDMRAGSDRIGYTMFKGLTYVSPYGTLPVYPDPFCPNDRAYFLNLDTWASVSCGKAPSFIELPDGTMYSFDDSQSEPRALTRLGALYNNICFEPQHNGVVSFA